FSPLWNNNVVLGGHPASATVVMKIAEQVGFFTGLGVVIVFLASVAFGKLLAVNDTARLAPADSETTEAYPTQPIG
ncbi:MAG TPA: hypothetical protein VHF26_26345, partial [Trebonia sp.]|nr:hypothetical protein [Trebonia sp.]